MKIRPGRQRSLIAGIAALAVTFLGAMLIRTMMSGPFSQIGTMNPNPVQEIFLIAWILVGLTGAGLSFYNAFSKSGLPLYEIDSDSESDLPSAYCPECGGRVEKDANFCQHCGKSLKR